MATKAASDNNESKRKRKRSNRDDTYRLHYQKTIITPRPSTGRPGTPHRYFSASYSISFQEQEKDQKKRLCEDNANLDSIATPSSQTATNNKNESSNIVNVAAVNDVVEPDNNAKNGKQGDGELSPLAVAPIASKKSSTTNNEITNASQSSTSDNVHRQQVIHHHANGLCIVTVGNLFSRKDDDDDDDSHTAITNIEFVAEKAPNSSAGEKRRDQSKLLKGKAAVQQQKGVVTPNSILAYLYTTNKSGGSGSQEQKKVPVYAGVWGHVLELNDRLTPELLTKDPLLDGYLAVILPTGRFPPLPVKDATAASMEPAQIGEVPTTGTVAVEQ